VDPIFLRIEPELDQRAATATMQRAQRVYEQGARDISRVMRDQMNQGTTAAAQGFGELETKARKAYLSMQDASEKVAAAERKHQQAVANGAANAESLGRRVERARLAEIEAIERATAAYNEYGQAAQQAGQQATGGLRGAVAGIRTAGGEAASGFMEGFAGSATLMRLGTAAGPVGIAIASAAALGIAGGKVLADNILAGMDQLRMRDLFQARLGVDSGTMQKIGDIAGASYAQGFGESVEGNLKTINAGIRSGLIGPRSSDADLAKFTERVDTTSKITGQDPTEIAAKTRNLIRNGLVRDYTEALDLLNSEAGKQLDISGDLLDTAEEYGTAWKGVGLSAADAFGLMKQLSDAGIRNTDVAADSLKELSISVADDSKTTRAAFVALGFDADEMNRRFAEGGASAREAFGAVLTALQDMKDPQDKTNIGLALFKTKWEDAKTAIKAADLKTAATDMGQVAGSTDRANEAINKHADSWGNLGRKIDEAWNSFQRWLADTGPGNFLAHTLPDALSRFFDDPPKPYVAPPPSSPAQSAQDLGDLLGAPGPAVQGPGISHGVDTSPQRPVAPTDIPGILGTILTPNPNLPVPGPGLQHGPQGHYSPEDAAGSKSLPPAPSLPLTYTNTAGLPSGIANAQQSLDEKVHDVAEKEARLNQLKQTNVATADDIQKAENDLTKANQDRLKAEQSLTDARINATKQANKQLAGLSSDMDQLGSQLDKDFGISKGLGGIVENAVKALGNALAAPLLQALGFVAKANPNEGSGLVGIAAANGMFGSQYTPGAIAMMQASQRSGGGGYPGGYAPVAAAVGGGQPYGLPNGTDIRQGAPGFPSWVYQVANAFGLQASTYAGHQEDKGQGNQGIDWWGPVENRQRFAEWLAQNRGMPGLEDVIFENPNTGQDIGVNNGRLVGTPGSADPGYFRRGKNDFADHRDHVHTTQSESLGLPGAPQATDSLNGLASAANSAANALGGPGGGWNADWNTMAQKEASGNWSANTGNGFYGGLQFTQPSWDAAGGTQYAPRADLASPYQQALTAEQLLQMQGPGAWPNTFTPGSAGPAAPGGGPMYPGIGPSQALPGISPLGQMTPAVGGGTAYPSQGGNSGNIFGGLPLDGIMAATSGLDLIAPGAGAAAKIGIQVANRTIGYAAQNAGILANGIGEFFSVGDNPKGSIGAGWFGKLAGGIAGAAPALPNLAGGKKPPGPMEQPGGQQQGGNTYGDTNINVESRPGASGQEHGEQIAAETGRMYAPAGRQ
jgi:phage-related minor tail protein